MAESNPLLTVSWVFIFYFPQLNISIIISQFVFLLSYG